MERIPLSWILSPYQEKEATKKAFTLVELIVVITILAILWTIAFISLQWYSRDARDWTRISDIKSTEVWLELFSIKVWKYPVPDNSVAYTWWSAVITQGILWEWVTRNTKLNKIVVDPLTKANYVYSTFWNWRYYQLAADVENLQASIVSQANAATPTSSLVRWNYTFDPTLPSIILVPSSVTSSWIFDKNVCFVLNWWKNTLNNCVEKKSQMDLLSFEPNLVAYWDMESVFSSWWTDYLKDLSWNWAYWKFNGGVFINNNLTWGILGKGISFNWVNNYITIPHYSSFNFNDRTTISIIFKIKSLINNYPKLICKWGVWWTYDYCLQFDFTQNPSSLMFMLQNTNTNIKGSSSTFIDYSKYMIFVWKYDWNFLYTYINGTLTNKTSFSWTIDNTISDIWIWARPGGWYYFSWIIDDVKIYNRALSDSEIMQQSKILGF